MLAVGEVLFDVIEGENKLGGAPFNVAAHLARLGHQSFILSAIGTDQLGDQILTEAADLKVSTELIHRNPHKPTGTVQVQFADGEPQYDIIENVAWDELQVDFEKVRERQWEIVVFGSLAQRSSHNRLFFEKLFDHLSVRWPYFDCNLRQNYYDQKLLERSFHWAKICKFNEHELNLSSKLLYGRNLDARDFASRLNRDFEVELVVYTWGKDGSRAWYQEEMYVQSSEKIKVADTIGAGDAFNAGFLHSWISENNVQEALKLGNKLGGFVASHTGAIPRYTPEILAALEK